MTAADAGTIGHRVQALTRQGALHAEGIVDTYVNAPTVGIMTDDGVRVWWRADQIRDLGTVPLAAVSYTDPNQLREVPRYTLDEAREILNPSDMEALEVLGDMIKHLTAHGGFIIPAYGDVEHRTEIRLDADPTRLGITLDNLRLVLAYAQHAPGNPDVERPKSYTLEEARAILKREECDEEGHDLETVGLLVYRSATVHKIECRHCGATFREDPR